MGQVPVPLCLLFCASKGHWNLFVIAAVQGSGRIQTNSQSEVLDSKNIRIKVCSLESHRFFHLLDLRDGRCCLDLCRN